MNKPKAPVDDIESPEERRRWLERYPAAGRERIPGREYLYLAFQEASEIAEREKLTSLEKFDKKHGIHYRCAEWLGRLLELLKDAGNQERYDEVRNWIQTMREED